MIDKMDYIDKLKLENSIETVEDYIKVAGKIREMIKGFYIRPYAKSDYLGSIDLLPENPYWVKNFSEKFNQEEWFKQMKIDDLWNTLGMAYEDHLKICERREKISKKIAEKTSGMMSRSLPELEQRAFDKLLENCRAEFCYGDPRVEKYKDEYKILGEEVIKEIHDDYLEWLNAFCETYAQDSASGEFTGVAIDWNGMEDQQPDFTQYLKEN